MKQTELPTSMEQGVYWYIDEDTKEVVFDEEEMEREFNEYVQDLKKKYSGIKFEDEK